MAQTEEGYAARVLHLGKYYPPHMGGMETHLQALVRGISGKYSIEVLVANDHVCRQVEHLDGSMIRRVPTFGTLASMPVTPTLPYEFWRSHADLVHIHTPNPGAAFSLAVSGYRGPLIITHHSDTLGRRQLSCLTAPFIRHVMTRADAIIVTSQRYLDSSNELVPYARKCHIIPLGIGEEAFRTPRAVDVQDIQEKFGPHIVLAVGRLVEYKGFPYLIRAIKQLDANLVIIGTGPEASALQSLANDLNIQSRVHFVGRVIELAPYFAAAEIFAFPSISRAEAFGMVQLEAMAAGLPVVNTDIQSAVPEISIHGQTGWTVPPGDSEALANALQSLLENNELRQHMGEAARTRAMTKYGVEQINERTMELYEAVLRACGHRNN
jgi:rhamnosyl/mannosyltransferase